ncbi:hypothetical protein [Pararhizobium haloflavum]|uniref:hypothetical protein n=1 Tax=Pararhizobium haloflavum TaxID=2037914 RepID=UPI0012FFD512|nr:hypothetical protein [Pararhizobium haloflavum]
MSDTDTMPLPPETFFADASGVMQWRAEIDGITVRRAFKTVVVTAMRGETQLSYTLTPHHARHLAALLTAAANGEVA